MGRDRIRRGALWVAAFLLAACGSAAQSRPVLVSTYPADGQVLTGPLEEIRLTYDEPVEVLNLADVRVFGRSSGLVPVALFQRAGEPESVYLRTVTDATYPLHEDLIVQVHEGAVVNSLRHYAGEAYEVGFTSGQEPPVLLGRPGQVTLLDAVDFASLGDVPTPGARDPVALIGTLRSGVTQRVWVQLASGGGSGASLAWFEVGDATMTPVLLSAAADLTATAGALALSPDGMNLYGAWRDTDDGGVRLARVATTTGLETGSLAITAVAVGGTTRPLDLRWNEDASQLVLCASEGASGRLAYVDVATFTEVDRDADVPGVQGIAVPAGGGRIALADGRVWIARPGTNDLEVVDSQGSVSSASGSTTGTSTTLWATPDGGMLVQGLAGYAGELGMQLRSADSGFGAPRGAAILDDVGGVDRLATAVLDAQPLSGRSRFALLLDSPGGVLLARFAYAPYLLAQEDLDPLSAGTQVADIETTSPGATILGRTFGTFAP